MRVIRQVEEAVPLVETFCGLVDGINFHGPDPDFPSEIFRSAEGIDQQELAEFLSLHGTVHRQSSDQYDGHVDLRQSLRLIFGQGFVDHGVIGEGVVSSDQRAAGFNQHVRPSQILLFELTHPGREPIVQNRNSAIEAGPVMCLSVKRFDDPGGSR